MDLLVGVVYLACCLYAIYDLLWMRSQVTSSKVRAALAFSVPLVAVSAGTLAYMPLAGYWPSDALLAVMAFGVLFPVVTIVAAGQERRRTRAVASA